MMKTFRFKNFEKLNTFEFPGINDAMLELVKAHKNKIIEMVLNESYTSQFRTIWCYDGFLWDEKWLIPTDKNGQYEFDF